MKLNKLIALLVALAMVLGLAACGGGGTSSSAAAPGGGSQAAPPAQSQVVDEGPAEGQRPYRVEMRGGGEDIVTVMLFMCGSDLESGGGAATIDLGEILRADIGEQVNVVIETGGASQWENDMVSPDTNQRWIVQDGDLQLLEEVGLRDMTDPDTLADFIGFCADNYPADRNILIFWDHGGGTMGGYASDENFPGPAMTLAEIDGALGGAGVVFDWIGFDCCLMGTAEIAFVMEKYADYFVGSQRSEPGGGWYYTEWLTALSQNTSLPTADIGEIIVDTFIREEQDGYYGDELTLTMLDLSWVPLLFEELYAYYDSAQGALIDEAAFAEVSQARYQSRSPGEEDYDQVDLVYLTQNLSLGDSGALLDALDRCIAYTQATMANYHGLSVYFPYTSLGELDSTLSYIRDIGIEDNYHGFLTSFASLMAGGQMYSGGGSGNPYGGDEDFDEWGDWLDEDLVGTFEQYYSDNDYDGSELEIVEKGDDFVLSMSDEAWALITGIHLQVFLDVGDGYRFLGSDNVWQFDEDGDMLVTFDDNTWVALNGQLVTFYGVAEGDTEDGGWYSYGHVPALLNGTEVELVVMWDDTSPDGYVLGYQHVYEGGTAARGVLELVAGDEIDFIGDMYTYDESYDDTYIVGGFVYDGIIEVSYEDVGDGDCLVYYALQDIYGNAYWTEPLIYSYDL